LQFKFRANISNTTGTSWDEVSIKLSTANPSQLFSLPAENNSDSFSNHGVKYKEVQLMNSIQVYNVPFDYTIPSDGKAYLVDVTSYSMPATFNYLLIPRLDPFGFLMGKIPGWNNYNLIPGQANIYNMGTFMGRTTLNSYSESDTLSLFLGKDRAISVMWDEQVLKNENNIIGNFSVEKTKIKMKIQNNSSEQLSIEILDLVPVIDEDEKLNVYDISNAIYNKEEGKLNWMISLKGKESMDIEYGYDWKSPKWVTGHRKPKHKKFRTVSCPTF
jgi:uncharacterized protein (TIGR02231 family)